MESRLLRDFFIEEKEHWWHIAKRALIHNFVKGERLKILVLGLGGGMLCAELKKEGHYVVGMDIAILSCVHAKKDLGVSVINGNAEGRLMFRDGLFDIVIAADILEHIDDDKAMLAEVFRCIKPKGVAVITVPAYQHMWSSWDRRLEHKRRYSSGQLKTVVKNAGFDLKKISYFNMMIYPFAYIHRKIFSRQSEDDRNERSDFSIFSSRAASGILAMYYALERKMLSSIDLPFGLSVIAIGVKK